MVVITAGFETFILEPSMHYINTNSWYLDALMWFNPYSGNSRSLVLGSKIQFKLSNPSSIHHGIQFHYDQFPFWIKTISTAYVPSYCKFQMISASVSQWLHISVTSIPFVITSLLRLSFGVLMTLSIPTFVVFDLVVSGSINEASVSMI